MQRNLQTFNYSDFRRRFRAAAARRGIDPRVGSTSYQAALVQADLRRAAILAAPDYGWWQGANIFSEGDPTPVDLARPAEHGAMKAVQFGGMESADWVPFDAASTRELWREVRLELRHVVVHDTPLATLHRYQRAWEAARQAAPEPFSA